MNICKYCKSTKQTTILSFKGIPNVTVKKRETQEDGSTSFVVTIESFPAPFAVQWMFKDKYTNTCSLIDVSDENYMGTINSLPNPVLVVKNHTQLRKKIYQIEITNYVGSTVKQVSCNVIDTLIMVDLNSSAIVFKNKNLSFNIKRFM